MFKTWPCIFCGSLSDTKDYICSRCDPMKDKRILTVEDIQRLEKEQENEKKAKRKKILIVEEDRPFALAMTLLFGKNNYEAVISPGGYDGVSAVYREKPALLVLAAVMSKMPGYDFLRHLDEQGFPTNKLPMIVTSSRADMEGMFDPWNINAFLVKPVQPNELLAHVQAVLGKDA